MVAKPFLGLGGGRLGEAKFDGEIWHIARLDSRMSVEGDRFILELSQGDEFLAPTRSRKRLQYIKQT
ncbi:hypothetical protein NEA10_18425 [Phormidium yuhuli AB48]|uniref:Uncharacterized protein n=1 Tax=Phormidium yuhuli AB48 TaxID=2940671 RepID=A0ABY5APS0_9CYAN|nr:hypothetical protein [Phormidium yuhuli]USR90771.1 hypothetical protein NEA10_18425 [Phormidium yuhuli AB48]